MDNANGAPIPTDTSVDENGMPVSTETTATNPDFVAAQQLAEKAGLPPPFIGETREHWEERCEIFLTTPEAIGENPIDHTREIREKTADEDYRQTVTKRFMQTSEWQNVLQKLE